jgi:hypothetical protein
VETEIIIIICENFDSSVTFQLADTKILKQLKKIFQDSTTSKSLKVTILTILPKSWSILKVQVFPSTSYYKLERAKQPVRNQGIMSSPNP